MDYLSHYKAGEEKFNQEAFQDAVFHFTESLAIRPDHVPSLHYRGLAFFKLQLLKKSVKDLDTALNLDPNNATIYSDRAVVKHLSGNNNEAIEDFNIAVKLEPDNPYRYSSRAYVRAIAGDLSGGIEDYQKAIELDPEDAVAYNNLGLLEEKLGYAASAKQHFDKSDQLTGVKRTAVKQEIDAPLLKEKEPSLLIPNTALPAPAPKPGVKDYLRVMKYLIFTSEGRKEFIDFFKKKK